MSTTIRHQSLSEAILPQVGNAAFVKRVVLLIVGVVALAAAAKISVPVPPSPVPVTLGTFAVLTIGAAYGPRLGFVTILTYVLIGAMGFNVFAHTTGTFNGPTEGIAYVLGSSGGYILGYVLAVAFLGWTSRRGMDRNVGGMAASLLVANVLIYVPGVLWLNRWIVENGKFNAENFATAWDQTLAWGLTPYLIGDAMKLAVVALLLPMVWRLVGNARK